MAWDLWELWHREHYRIAPGSGWRKYHECGDTPKNAFWASSTRFFPTFNCADGQALNWDTWVNNPTVQRGRQTLVVGRGYFTGGGSERFENDVWFDRPATSPSTTDDVPVPYPVPAMQPEVVPGVPAWADPLSTPWDWPGFPEPPPYVAQPYITPNPWRAPSEQTQQGPEPTLRQRPGFSEGTPFKVTEIVAEPNGDTTINNRPRDPNKDDRKKRDKEKDKKVKVKGIRGLYWAFNAVTESLDAANSIWKALPSKYRSGSRSDTTQWERFADLYNNWEHINWGMAITNMYEDVFFTDRLFGALGQHARTRFDRGIPIGLGAGPWDNVMSDMGTEYRHDARYRNDRGFNWTDATPTERRAERRRRRQERRAVRQQKRGGSNRRNTGTVRYAKDRNGNTYSYVG